MRLEDFIINLKKVKKNGNQWLACCPSHKDNSPSLSVTMGNKGIILRCFAGCTTESIVSAMGLKMADLFNEQPKEIILPTVKPKIVETYIYQDALGKDLFRVARIEPGNDGRKKRFSQQGSDGKGGWQNNMDGVVRVLYNLPAIIKSEQVVLVEGERKANWLNELGFTATCNVGGAGKWMDAWTDALKDKQIVICADSDEPGQNHARLLHQALSGHVKDILHIHLPKPNNDIVDFFKSIGDDKSKRTSAFTDLLISATNVPQNLDVPIYSMAQLETQYIDFIGKSQDTVLHLYNWLPSFKELRGIVPGELVTILADTGTGKTMALHNICMAASPLHCLLFEMELPASLSFERAAALACGCSGEDVEAIYKTGKQAQWRDNEQVKRIFTCSESNLTIERMRELIHKAQLVMGVRPAIVMLDYIQLMRGKGDRYEKTSDAAEQLKVMAKEENVILITASQVHRKQGDENKEITLHSGKDSGSIENSSGAVLGLWRDGSEMIVRLLKFTKGRSSAFRDIRCDIDRSLRIREIMPDQSAAKDGLAE